MTNILYDPSTCQEYVAKEQLFPAQIKHCANGNKLLKLPPERTFTFVLPYASARLGKTILPDGTIESAGNARRFGVHEYHHLTLESLWRAINGTRRRRENFALLYGARIGGDELVLRQKAGDAYGTGKTRSEGFKDVPRAYLFLDIDDAPTPDNHDWIEDPESAVEQLINDHLPCEFHDISFIWHFTGTHGLFKPHNGCLNPDRMNVRLIFFLDKALNDGQRRAWFKLMQAHSPHIDPAAAGSVQLNYIRPPEFEPPWADPFDGLTTCGYVERSADHVNTPAPNRLDQQKVKAQLRQQRLERGDYMAPPDATDAEILLQIGTDGHIREHLHEVIKRMVKRNGFVFRDKVEATANELMGQIIDLVTANTIRISTNLAVFGRTWQELEDYLVDEVRFCMSYIERYWMRDEDTPTARFPICPVSLTEGREKMKRQLEEFRDVHIPAAAAAKAKAQDINRQIANQRYALADLRAERRDMGSERHQLRKQIAANRREVEEWGKELKQTEDQESREWLENNISSLLGMNEKLQEDIGSISERINKFEPRIEQSAQALEELLSIEMPKSAPVYIKQDSPGAGKSTKAIEIICEDPTQNVALLNPTHKLGSQVRDDVHKLTNSKAGAMRGYQQPVDENIKIEEATASTPRMCMRFEDAKITEEAGLSVAGTMCMQEIEGTTRKCRFYDRCPMIKNKRETFDANIIIGMHAHGHRAPLREVTKREGDARHGSYREDPPAAVIQDEDSSLRMIGSQSIGHLHSGLLVRGMSNIPAPIESIGAAADDEEEQKRQAFVHAFWAQFERVCKSSANGMRKDALGAQTPLLSSAFIDHDVTANDCKNVLRWHNQQIGNANAYLQITDEGENRKNIIQFLNPRLQEHRERAHALRTIIEFLGMKEPETGEPLEKSGRAILAVTKNGDRDGTPQLVLAIRKINRIAEGWLDMGANMIMSATPASDDILSEILGGREIHRFEPVEIEHAHRVQWLNPKKGREETSGSVTVRYVPDSQLTHKKLGLKHGETKLDNFVEGRPSGAVTEKRYAVARVLRMRQREHGQILIATTKPIAEMLRTCFKTMGWVTEGLHFLSWGEVEGINKFEDFSYMCVIGSKDVGDKELRAEACAITGRYFSEEDERYGAEWESVGQQMSDGSVQSFESWVYSDPLMASLHTAHTSDLILQAVHRLRLVNPKPHDRLVEIFAAVPTAMAADELVSFEELVTVSLAAELHDRGINGTNTAIAEAAPDLFSGRKSVAEMRRKLGNLSGEMADAHSIYIYYEEVPKLRLSEDIVFYTSHPHLYAVKPNAWATKEACRKWLAENPQTPPENFVTFNLRLDGKRQREYPIHVDPKLAADEMALRSQIEIDQAMPIKTLEPAT